MSRRHATPRDRMPPGADLATLRVWAEWRRQGMSINELARRSGHSWGRVRALLTGKMATRNRALVVADLAKVLGL